MGAARIHGELLMLGFEVAQSTVSKYMVRVGGRRYNGSRTHSSLNKDTPLGRAVQRYGNITATPVLSWLYHRYRGYDFQKGHEAHALNRAVFAKLKAN